MEFPKVQKEIYNPISENVKKLAKLFPAAVKDGQVDFEALKSELGEFETASDKLSERYELGWAGKEKAKQLAKTDIVGKTLKYIPEDSKNPETTENLYIEGDNLDVLKLLRNSYYNKIKMIYIDPPYNTGNDFIYKDDFAVSEEENSIAEGEIDEAGERLIVNQKSNGKYHSNWLSMMYPRLRIAKDLLKEDGVIFISIDDNEVDNLKKLCDEVFGEENFINIVSVKMKNNAGASGGGEDKRLKKNLEYILIYVKDYDSIKPFNAVYSYEEISKLLNEYRDNDISWKYTSVLYYEGEKKYLTSTVDGDGNEIKIFERLNPIYKSVNQIAKEEDMTEKQVYYEYFSKIFTTAMPQSSIRVRVVEAIDKTDSNEDLYSIEYIPKSGRNKGIIYEQFYKGSKKRLLTWFKDVGEIIDNNVYKRDIKGTYWDGYNLNNLTKEGNVKFENGKKPLALIMDMIRMTTSENDIILDFFSGSATTAHATMQLNIEDNVKRSFIMVQYPEVIEPTNKDSKEYISYLSDEKIKPIVTEIGKERIRRAGEKIKEENKDKEGIENLDIGFKVFKVTDTNIRWFSEAIKSNQVTIDESKMTDKDKLDFNPGYTDIDVVYEILLRHRDIPLSTNVEKLTCIGARTYIFADAVVVCLEENVTESMIDKIAAIEPMPSKVIFRDSAFGDDISLKTNTMLRLEAQIKKNSGIEKKAYRVEFI